MSSLSYDNLTSPRLLAMTLILFFSLLSLFDCIGVDPDHTKRRLKVTNVNAVCNQIKRGEHKHKQR